MATASTTSETAAPLPPQARRRGGWITRSLRLRMVALAAAWIVPVLGLGGYALDRVLTTTITRNFEAQLDVTLTAMISAADIDETGEVRFLRPLGDQRFFEPYSGLYWQVSGRGHEPFRSRSLWDRVLDGAPAGDCRQPCRYPSARFADEPLRVVGRTVRLPGSNDSFYFQVAQSSQDLSAQIAQVRSILGWSLAGLGVSLLALTALQSLIGLSPLGRVSRGIAAIRSGAASRVPMNVPLEVAPLVDEINALLAHSEAQAEAARLQAGNLAHALKTPMTVLVGESQGEPTSLARTVRAQVAVMRRHVDHHLARARAMGRRGAVAARAPVWPALEGVARTVERIHRDPPVTIDLAGDRTRAFRGERQDLEEMLGNLVDNAAKYGGGRVFVTVEGDADSVAILVEDDGPGLTPDQRARLFTRGERLDTDKPGTGLGLAIVRDVAEIYGGTVALEESEDLGGLLVRLTLPAAER